MIASAADSSERLIGRQAEGDLSCRLPQATVDEFAAAGYFHILQPARFGGAELPAQTLFRLEIELAKSDMSAAWVVGNMGVAAFHAALFASDAQTDIWGANPDARIATSNMPGGRLKPLAGDMFRIEGRWRFSSGVRHADWVILGAILETDDAPVAGAVLVPAEDITIVEDWDVVGLRGTGSHAIEIAGAGVPAHRFLPHIQRFDGTCPGRDVHAGSALYALPLPQLLFRSISSASIGGLAGMLEHFVATNRDRSSMMGQRIAMDPHVLDLCGRISADIVALENGLAQDFRNLGESRRKNSADDIAMRLAMRLNVTRIPDLCFRHAADLLRAAGASALYRDSRILRYFNDMVAARQHAANQFELHARASGASLFGDEKEDILL